MKRLDNYLVEQNLVATRSAAQNLIKLEKVSVNGRIITKCALHINEGDSIVVNNDLNNSIGCYKLIHAINEFELKDAITNAVCMDVGASNGGFTSVLLDNGAKRVYAVDIGENALSDKLTNNSRVVIKEKINAKNMSFDVIGEKIDIITIDVSFISLTMILPNIKQFMNKDSLIVALLKPQFELGKENLGKSGIVKNPKLYDKLIIKMHNFCQSNGLEIMAHTQNPKLFEKKNIEFLLLIKLI